VLSVRAGYSGEGATISLVQGATVISGPHALPFGVVAASDIAIPPADAANITDYSDLRARVQVIGAFSGSDVTVAELSFSCSPPSTWALNIGGYAAGTDQQFEAAAAEWSEQYWGAYSMYMDGPSGPAALEFTGTLAQASNTVAATVASAIAASSTATQAANTAIATATVAIAATANITQAPNTVAGAAAAPVAGTAGVAQGANTVASSVTVAVVGTGAATQGANALVATGTVAVTATLNATQADDLLAAVFVAGEARDFSAALQQDDQTVAATATVAQPAPPLAAGAARGRPAWMPARPLWPFTEPPPKVVVGAVLMAAAMQQADNVAAARVATMRSRRARERELLAA
jgi:hypothetical protein